MRSIHQPRSRSCFRQSVESKKWAPKFNGLQTPCSGLSLHLRWLSWSVGGLAQEQRVTYGPGQPRASLSLAGQVVYETWQATVGWPEGKHFDDQWEMLFDHTQCMSLYYSQLTCDPLHNYTRISFVKFSSHCTLLRECKSETWGKLVLLLTKFLLSY